MGDVTARDFLETRGLLPKYQSSAKLYIAPFSKEYIKKSDEVANYLREKGINISVDYTGKKVGDQIKKADKDKIPFVVVIGEDEAKNDTFKVKNLFTGEEKISPLSGLSDIILNS